MELLLVAAGGGGASSYSTNSSSEIDANGLLNPLKDHRDSQKIPNQTEDAGMLQLNIVTPNTKYFNID